MTPNELNIKVILTQNSSLFKETFTNNDGYYLFDNIPNGNYGLLFIYNNLTYIYDDLTNKNLVDDIGKVIFTEKITPDSLSYNIDLGKQNPDYEEGRLNIRFDSEVSETEIENILKIYNLKILGKYQLKSINKTFYSVVIHTNKTVIEVIKSLNMQPIVEYASISRIIYLTKND